MNSLQDLFQTESPVALVTGSGAPRVGRAIAEHLAGLGCGIAFHANTSRDEADAAAESAKQEYGVRTLVTLGSMADDTVPSRIVDETFSHFGRIDILVNSAAIWRPTSLNEVTADEIREYFQINTVSSFLCARAAGEKMASQPTGGSIINVAVPSL